MVQLSTFVGAAALASSVLAAPAKYQYYQYEQVAPEELVEEEHVPVYEEKIVAPHVTTTEHVAPQYKYNYHTTTALAAEETYVYEQEHEAVYEPIHEVVYEPEHDTTTLLEQEFEETTYEYVPEHTPEYIPEHVIEETTLLPEETHVAEKTWSSDYAYPTYGSGQSEWGAGYDDCVSQCVAKYGAPKEKYTPVVKPDEVHKGNGVIHTVMVAPEKGVLRYFPFALNATVGDTVRYVWSTPANHTATLSSELALCNRSALAESRDFVSGIRNGVEGESVFDVVVQTEEPQFFYCSVQQHCEKGMWGVINPKSEFGGVNTVGSKWSEWMESNPDLKAAWSYVHETSRTKPEVDDWANNINLDTIPEAAYEDLAANIVWNRAMYDANPGVLENGKGAETPDGSPLTLVEDLSILLSATNQDPAAVNQPAGTPTGALPDPSEVAEELAATSGASKNVAGLSVATILAVVSWMLF